MPADHRNVMDTPGMMTKERGLPLDPNVCSHRDELPVQGSPYDRILSVRQNEYAVAITLDGPLGRLRATGGTERPESSRVVDRIRNPADGRGLGFGGAPSKLLSRESTLEHSACLAVPSQQMVVVCGRPEPGLVA